MASIFSIGRTLSRTMPSMRSSSLPRKRDRRAGLGQRILRFVELHRALGVDLVARGRGLGLDLLRLRLARRGDPRGVGETRGGLLLGLRLAGQAQRLALGFARRGDQFGRLAAFGDLALARRDRLLLGVDRLRPRSLCGGDGDGAFGGRLRDRDRALDLGELDRPVALDLQAADLAVARHARLCQAPFGRDARPFDLLAGGDLGLLERLPLGDVERVERALAFEPRGIERALLSDAGGLDILGRGDLRPPLLGLRLRQLGGLHRDARSGG